MTTIVGFPKSASEDSRLDRPGDCRLDTARTLKRVKVQASPGDFVMTIWKGVFPAVTTKMTSEGLVDLKATQASLDRLIQNGVAGVIVLPMLGENASLSPSERESVIRAAVEVVHGRVPLLSGLAEITLDGERTCPRLRALRRRRPDGFPQPRLQDRSARNSCVVQRDRLG